MAARGGRRLSVLGMTLALMKNYDPFKAPTHFKLVDLMKKFDKTFGATKSAHKGAYGRVEWHAHGRRSGQAPGQSLELPAHCRHVVPGSVQLRFPPHRALHHPVCDAGREICFCAYNTGIGWRNIIEKMHMTATLTKWYEEHGRHQISPAARTSSVVHGATPRLNPKRSPMASRPTRRHGIAKTAREEKLRAQGRKQAGQEHQRMAVLYRQLVLKQAPPEPTIQIAGLGGKKKSEPQVLHKNQE